MELYNVKKHQQWLVDQYNRNRATEDQVKNFAEYNRKMLDLEIKHKSRKDNEKI
jgi:hypothetical protein